MTAGRTVNSSSQNWATPHKYVTAVKKVLGEIHLDPCSNNFSIVNAGVEYHLPEQDGLVESWNYPTIYVNPPYGRDKQRGTTIKDWLKRCYEANKTYNSEVLALIPVATNTSHWKEYIWNAATCICFLYDTRLKFIINGEEENKGAPMACAMVHWGSNSTRFRETFSAFGAVVNI